MKKNKWLYPGFRCYAYTLDFTSESFVEDMLEHNAVSVEKHLKNPDEYGDLGICVRLFFTSTMNSVGCVEFGFPD